MMTIIPLSLGAFGTVIIEQASAVLVGGVEYERLVTVPSDRRWILYCIAMTNEDTVTRTMTFSLIYAELPAWTRPLTEPVAYSPTHVEHACSPSTGLPAGPLSKYNCFYKAIPLSAGDTIRFYFSAGVGGAGGIAQSDITAIEVLV